MYFSNIKLKNFGPYSDAEFHFEPNTVNWVIGNNATGKTQLAGALVAAIVGRSAIAIAAGGTSPSEVEVTITEEETTERASLVITEDQPGKIDVSKRDGPLVLKILAAMNSGQKLLIEPEQFAMSRIVHISDIKDIPRDWRNDPLWNELFEDEVFNATHASGGQRSIVELVLQLAAQRRATLKLPLIFDEWAWRLPQRALPFFSRILEEIASDSQVIIFATPNYAPVNGRVQVVSASWSRSSLAGYNPRYEIRRPNLRKSPSSKWVLGSKLSRQENRTCEFKEVKGNSPLGAIKAVVDQYAVAFLNAGVPQEGAIFWGIRDEDHSIVGVKLSAKECDELRRLVTERLHQIIPPVAPTAYRIDLHPVSDRNTLVDDLYVVEVCIPSMRRTLLYATGSQEVYVKTDAGKKRLSVLELQQELVRRLGVDPDF